MNKRIFGKFGAFVALTGLGVGLTALPAAAYDYSYAANSCIPATFGYEETGHGARLWGGSWFNCLGTRVLVRADISNGADSSDKWVDPGQTVTWDRDTTTAQGSEFRGWKACAPERCA